MTTPNPNLSSGQFHLVSNMKAKPNSQGTLFSADPSQRKPESRQPRGYSPERYKAVSEATDLTRKNGSMRIYGGYADVAAKALSEVARSTVPLSDLKRPHPDQPASQENPDLHIGVRQREGEGYEVAKGAAAFYQKPGTTAIPDQGRVALYNDAYHDGTVIHEIGHHASHLAGNEAYDSPSSKGAEEGRADKYLDTHGRTAGYKQKPMPRDADYQPFGHQDPGQTGQFGYSYRKERHGNSLGPLQPDQFGSDLPKEHVKGQMPMLDKVNSFQRVGSPEAGYSRKPVTNWDYNHETHDSNGSWRD